MTSPTRSPAGNRRTGIAIIGGGVAGVSAALVLAEAGVETMLFEKGRIAGEQSSRNWGWIRKQGRAYSELPLMLESSRLWARFASEVEGDIGYRVGGSTYLATTEAELEERATWLQGAQAFGLDSRLLDAIETDRLLDQSERRFVGALHTPSDAYAEPALAVPALARLAAQKGATIHEGEAVRTLYREAGRVAGVVTERGLVRAEAVILAGGIWSRSLLENEGMAFPQLAIRSSAQRTERAPKIATSLIGAEGASIRPRDDGGYTIGRVGAARFDLIPAAFRHLRAFWPIVRERWSILTIRAGRDFFGPLGRHRWEADEASPFEAVRTMDPAPDTALLDDVLESARQLYPQLAQARVAERWAGMIDVMPDEIPVVSAARELPGLVLATGLSGHGFGLGPGVGQRAAELALGLTPSVDAAGLDFARFSADAPLDRSATAGSPSGRAP